MNDVYSVLDVHVVLDTGILNWEWNLSCEAETLMVISTEFGVHLKGQRCHYLLVKYCNSNGSDHNSVTEQEVIIICEHV